MRLSIIVGSGISCARCIAFANSVHKPLTTLSTQGPTRNRTPADRRRRGLYRVRPLLFQLKVKCQQRRISVLLYEIQQVINFFAAYIFNGSLL
nr:hypothetical protein CFP56_61810 [Quercus suber]